MKRLCVLLLAAAMCVSVCACGGDSGSEPDASENHVPPSSDPVDFSQMVTVVVTPSPAVVPTIAPVYTPAPTVAPVYQPAQTVEPVYAPVYAPTPTPIPTAAPVYNPITKNPTSETVYEGGSALFIANASSYVNIIWVLANHNGSTVYNVDDASAHFPGLGVSGQGTTNLTLSNIPYALNGWRAQAHFVAADGTWYTTSGAYITVLQGSGVNPGSGTVNPGSSDPNEANALNLAKQMLTDLSAYGSRSGYSVSAIQNYSYKDGIADFNVTLTNPGWSIVVEGVAYYLSSTQMGYYPLTAVVYNSSWEKQMELTSNTMDALYNMLNLFKS